MPSIRMYGAVLLGAIMSVAFITVLRRHEFQVTVSSAILLGIAVFVALERAPSLL